MTLDIADLLANAFDNLSTTTLNELTNTNLTNETDRQYLLEAASHILHMREQNTVYDTVYVMCRYSVTHTDELIDPTTRVFSTLDKAKQTAQLWNEQAERTNTLEWTESVHEPSAIEATAPGLYYHIAVCQVDSDE
jgi:hypothetical protein